MTIEQSDAVEPAAMVVPALETPSAVVRFSKPPDTPPNADSASCQVHPVPAVSVVAPRLSPNAANPHDPVWVMVNVIVFDCATLCAPVNDSSVPVITSTRSEWAVKLPVFVLVTVIALGDEPEYPIHEDSEFRADTPTVFCCVSVRPPLLVTTNVFDSSASVKTRMQAFAGGVKLAVVAGLVVPFTHAGEEASIAKATRTSYSGLTPGTIWPMLSNTKNPFAFSSAREIAPDVPEIEYA